MYSIYICVSCSQSYNIMGTIKYNCTLNVVVLFSLLSYLQLKRLHEMSKMAFILYNKLNTFIKKYCPILQNKY